MLGNDPIECVTSYKFLGVTFDSPGLKWKQHIENVKDKCMTAVSIMKSLSNYKWGAEREVLLRVYASLIRNRMDYCCHVYNSYCFRE